MVNPNSVGVKTEYRVFSFNSHENPRNVVRKY